MQTWNYAELTFMTSTLLALLRLVWYAKEIVDDVKSIITTQTDQQATLDRHEVAIQAHNKDIAVLQVTCPLLNDRKASESHR